jgi:hypothetical protein
MASLNHTPAPWETVGTIVRTPLSAGGIEIAECPPWLDERRENARLIAAAPELLAALRDCVAFIERDLSPETAAHAQPELRAARAAIARAEGQS